MSPLSKREVTDVIREIFSEKIPFNRILQLELVAIDDKTVRVRFPMAEAFIGNYVRSTLHGGVISATLDAVGGIAAFVAVLQQAGQHSTEIEMDRFDRLGTIDLRIDYLRPGRGQHFDAAAYILRQGRRVVVTRMELHNDTRDLIAVSTGAYNVG